MSDPAGAELFARYAYPPNALGLCGADEPRALLEHGEPQALAELARTFEGAWPYLSLIAAENRLDDPLDRRVVEAYWVGNALLDRVSPARLALHVEERFRGRIGRAQEHVLDAVRAGAVPHHAFHVFAVYPWLGLLRSGIVDEPLHVLDRCRIAPALVVARRDGEVDVLVRELAWRDGRLVPGDVVQRRVRCATAAPAPGERVSLHWDVVCDVLTPGAAQRLSRTTVRTLAAVNAGSTVQPVLA